jgi:cell division protein FtsL
MLAEKYAYLEDRALVMEPVRKEEPKRQEETRQLPVRKHQTLRKVLTIGMVLVCFATACFTIYRYSQIAENHREILALEKVLEKEELRMENLKVELAYRKDLNTIEFSATEMGMRYPDEGQVEYVNLPEVTKVVEQADASAAEPSLWSRFLGLSN